MWREMKSKRRGKQIPLRRTRLMGENAECVPEFPTKFPVFLNARTSGIERAFNILCRTAKHAVFEKNTTALES